MKRILMLATSAFLVTGVAFAHDGGKKKCATDKEGCKGGKKEMSCCNKGEKKETKTTVKAAVKKG